MNFFARLKPTSTVFQRWTARNAVSGIIEGVQFTRRMNGQYVSGNLNERTLPRMQVHRAVLVEMSAVQPLKEQDVAEIIKAQKQVIPEPNLPPVDQEQVKLDINLPPIDQNLPPLDKPFLPPRRQRTY